MGHSNIDDNERKKFATYDQDWWDINGVAAPLHKINPLRMAFITEIIGLKQKNILDVGCGGGILSEALASAKGIVTGIDITASAIETAQQHAQDNNLQIDYRLCSIEDMQVTDYQQHFDIITCMEMLEHVPDPKQIVHDCVALLKPGGFFFCSTLNRNMAAFLCGIIGAEYVLNLIPKGTHSYDRFIKPSELNTWAEQANLQLLKTIGITYNPFSKTFYTTPLLTVNYIMCFQKKPAKP